MRFLCWLLGHDWLPVPRAEVIAHYKRTGDIGPIIRCARCGEDQPPHRVDWPRPHPEP